MNAVTGEARRAARWGLGHGLPTIATTVRARRGDIQAQAIRHTRKSQDLPLELFDQIRAAGPMYAGKFASVTTRHSVVKEVLSSHDVRAGFSLEGGDAPPAIGKVLRWANETIPMGPLAPPSLLATEPPDHTRMRRLVTRVFTVKAVEQLRDRAERIAHELIDDIERQLKAGHPVDLIETYASQLPVTMICQILGIPAHEQDVVRRFGGLAAPSLDLGLGYRRFREVELALDEFDHWLRDHVEMTRANPGDDLLGKLVAVRDDDGQSLTDDELIATAGLVLAAGFETTVNLIGNATALLAERPEQRKALLAGDVTWENAVEESLRYDPPVLLTARTTNQRTQIAGVDLPRERVIVTLLAGANRDPEVFSEPDRFDVSRDNAHDHVSFSSGRHFCLGAALARMEGHVALQSLHERLPDLRIGPGAERRDTRILRGYVRLPIRQA